MRVGIIALQHESNTFLPTSTTLEDFKRGVLVTGDALIRRFEPSHHEIGGFIDGLREAGIEIVPIFAAQATPSGTIVPEADRALLDMMLRELERAGTLGGLLVAPHGAGVCESEPDMDGHWVSTLRQRIGQTMPMISTLDLHANVSRRMIDSCDA